jgi:hypothetical protein
MLVEKKHKDGMTLMLHKSEVNLIRQALNALQSIPGYEALAIEVVVARRLAADLTQMMPDGWKLTSAYEAASGDEVKEAMRMRVEAVQGRAGA